MVRPPNPVLTAESNRERDVRLYCVPLRPCPMAVASIGLFGGMDGNPDGAQGLALCRKLDPQNRPPTMVFRRRFGGPGSLVCID